IGEYWYRTETYTTRDSKGNMVTKTRRVRETEWWPLSGRHHRYYSGYLVSGSKGLAQDQAERIKPFNLPALKRYEPMYLAGWMSEEYSVARDAALQRCQQEFNGREHRNVGAFLPGDTHRSLEVSTSFSDVNSDLCLLPMYILSYRYGDKLFRFLVNGQTGRCAGDKPWSWKRISLFSVGVAAVILAVVIIVVVLSNV
ncbi:MAG: zinc ribbon domain-containing protein, partial [Pirellulaceae bacterium]|nr:zinc ribbon domain-containing protein [Pirellulaceae bacterium]